MEGSTQPLHGDCRVKTRSSSVQPGRFRSKRVVGLLYNAYVHADRALIGIEARSRAWQLMSRSWNAVVNGFREVDHLSDVESDLLFSVLRGDEIEAFFGAPEYIIFPTMITSPVFDHKSWGSDLSLFAPAKPALLQTCDLICWLLVALGLTPEADRIKLRGVLHELAHLAFEAVRHDTDWTSRLLQLRSSFAALCTHLLEVAHTLQRYATTRRLPLPSRRRGNRGPAAAGASPSSSVTASRDASPTRSPMRRGRVGLGGESPKAMRSSIAHRASIGSKALRGGGGGGGNRGSVANIRAMGRAQGLRLGNRGSMIGGSPERAVKFAAALDERINATPGAQQNLARARASMASNFRSAEQLAEVRKSVLGVIDGAAGEQEEGVDDDLSRCLEDLGGALPMLLEVMQNVSDIFSGEEIAMMHRRMWPSPQLCMTSLTRRWRLTASYVSL